MRRLPSLLLITGCVFFACMWPFAAVFSQSPHFVHPDSLLIGERPLPKVLLVGTWHFNYPGLDAHVTEESDRMNIFSDRRQRELQELLDYIARFRPTQIAVEGGRNSGYLIRHFERWKAGTRPLDASEIDQIAVRLMDRFQLDTLYGVNAYPLLRAWGDARESRPASTYIDSLLLDEGFGGRDSISQRYHSFYAYKDQLVMAHSLLDNFLYINSDAVLNRGFGAYLVGRFKSEDHRGPDALAMDWFDRNLRIFRNIQQIVRGPEDRVLVLFGLGHIQILNYLFECSPEFDLVPFGELHQLKLPSSLRE